ncbi:fungal-specific transcription factor domain-containing protein [Xylaria cf. heliscus]|nr:fungal-specific transcription factor domain-containing protein [Xylaria cf. heliscus]
MAASIRINARSTKRTKTFTGCWTCRSRKVKCDETRPRCRVCLDRYLTCEGYGARLQWLTPDTGDDENVKDIPPSASLSRTVPLRSQIPATLPQAVLPSSHVEDILRIIDSVEASPHVPGDNVSINIQNFGVFDLGWSRRTCYTPSQESAAYSQHMPTGSSGAELRNYVTFRRSVSPDVPLDDITMGLTSQVNSDGGVSPSCSEAAAAWDLCRLHDQGTQWVVSLEHPENSSPTPQSDSTRCNRQMSNTSALSITPSPMPSWCAPNDSPLTFPMGSPIPSPVPEQERFLLHHYMHRVVNLFCVIDNAKTPWKTIHLPRVLQSVGEMNIVGSTSVIRNALGRALLSISAFYMSNDYTSRCCVDEAKHWEDAASRLRGDAIGFLKQAVETDLYSSIRPRYKEFLATMLSMISINVMSGETSTCGVHLDGAEQLIKHMRSRKERFSKKAQSLHRIYYYLRVIYESTACTAWARNGTGSRFSTIFSPRDDLDASSADVAFQDSGVTIETPMSASSIESLKPVEMSTYEFIYGIPQRLLALLKDTTELIGLVDEARAKSGSSFVPEELSVACDELERDILDWPLEEQLNRCRSIHAEIKSEIIYHQTRAFYHAVVIYFSQNIRLLSYRYLHQYIEAVLESIEAIETIKTQSKILASPLFWPAFIAATEAFEKSHQERFQTWHETVEVYGIAAAKTGIQVVNEIWKQGPSISRKPISSWRAIARKTGLCLMLT